jgi:tRNA (guanine37-N1)-methyltransferase
MKFTILTLFPEVYSPIFKASIIGRALRQKKIKIDLINPRDFATDSHRTVDDKPFGGGVGMILQVPPIFAAIQKAKKGTKKRQIILLTPQGKVFNQKIAQRLTRFAHLILICGHYEGVDARVGKLADEEISIGDYILTGGEIPAMVIVDAVTRLIPGVLKKPEAALNESFSNLKLLEYPQYTRPADFRGMKVPPVLLSGNHQKIKEWRLKEALRRTRQQRPDLLTNR